MTDIVSIITDNLVWILVGIVVILLAIIGRYADQTNFGEGKKIIKVKKKRVISFPLFITSFSSI